METSKTQQESTPRRPNHRRSTNGVLDADGKALTLAAEGPGMTEEGKLTKYRDAIEFKSDEHRTLTSYVLGEDGAWHRFMTANYWRIT